jgi:DNA replication protein DnaC/transposase
MLQYAVPPGYQRQQPIRRPKLGPWIGVIDAILDDDKQRPVKQRHTAKRIFDRLREEHGFTGGYTIVKDYVRSADLRSREMFVPLAHAPGEAQADFGEALVVIAGVEQKAHYLAMDLPHSDDCFVAAFPAETTEAFLEGHVRAFAYFGGVPTRILYDNTKIAVARILGGEERQRTRAFSELQSYYLIADKFGRPARANDKGKVEGLVGYARRNFMVPIPHFNSWEELNTHLQEQCRKRRERRLRGHSESIGERFERDRAAMLPLPATPYEACEKISARVSSLALVRYRGNDYSVPTQYGHRQVWVKGYVHDVVIACGSEVIARHQRSYEREAVVFDPLHYLALLEQKTRALDQAAPLAGWQLPECFSTLRRLLEARLKEARQPRVCAGAAPAGDLRPCGSHARHRRRFAAGYDQLRRRAPSAAVPYRTQAAAAGHAELSSPAAGAGANHAGHRLHDPADGGTRMSNDPSNTAVHTSDTPQLLLEHHLKELRLPTILREYDKVARQCAVEQVDYQRYLLRMTELELLDRERRATERRIRQARFPVVKTMDSFDFLAMPSVNKTLVLELARCEFLARRENVLLLGNSGTGKTHIALALGLAACQRGHRVRFTTTAALVGELIEARDDKKLLRFQKQIASYELLIVDELGFVPLSKTGAELLFEMLSQRYERGSTLITSNLPFQEWTEILGSERLTGALLDRLTHHVHILEMNGDSFRLKQSRRKRAPANS